ncbi:MAG: LTA synthase family protein, partial [Alistipes sp.]|nr:LTA synthase family protein [Alistipes sp.]
MKQKAFQTVTSIYARLAALALGIGLLLRIALLWNPSTTDIGFSLGEWLEIFFVGAINDLAVFTLAFGGLWLFMMSVTELKYRRPWGYLILAVLVGLCCYVLFFNSIFHQYSGAARRIATLVFCYWAVTFALRLFLPQMRPYWSRIWWTILSGIYVGAILMNGISEWIFWSEFGVRYNFIAVDYLVYTHEVVGNIIESYPIGWLVSLLVAVTCGVQWLLLRRFDRIEQRLNEGAWRWASVGIYGL